MVIAIISLLATILMPSLSVANAISRSTRCLSNLHGLGSATGLYHANNNGYFWPYMLNNWPTAGVRCYWWGTDADPVDPSASPFMNYCNDNLAMLWCPSLQWGTYIPQGSYVSEPTTTYGYNAYCLDPTLNGKNSKNISADTIPLQLFIFNDSGMHWTVMGNSIFQNSTYLEPVTGMPSQMPTSHFRHRGRTNALCADSSAASFTTEGWQLDNSRNLGFVGTQNDPHYDQE